MKIADLLAKESIDLQAKVGSKAEALEHLVALMAKSGKKITPCFVCRQTLIDYCNEDLKIISYYDDKTEEFTVGDLCVYTFSDKDLK